MTSLAAALLFWVAFTGQGTDATVPPAPLPILSPAREADRWLAEDKLRHFLVSFGALELTYGALRTAGLNREPAMVAGAAVTAAAGLWKEWRDRRAGGPFSGKDLVWDALGILAGLAVAANTR